ncbi:MAG: hypothetical protein JWN34_4015 [Bryobacterales bacterium]|nr:hypothetical protein [Bryobacterales bacterium]
MPDLTVDVCIAGAGPAGAALALRLAQLGRTVALVEKSPFPRTHIGESLTGGVMPLLDALGVRSEIEAAGFIVSAWATVEWGGELRRYQVHGGPGLQVDRGRFDGLLLAAADRFPEVKLHQPARITEHQCTHDRWICKLDTGQTISARYVADAAGRARLLPGVKRPIGVPTLALYSYWNGVADCEHGDTLVEAGPSGWYWGAPLPGGECNVAAFVDKGSPADYVAKLRESKMLWPRLRDAEIRGKIFACDATPYEDECPVTANSIKVGDAALSIDPLSSQGVQTAIGTAIHAAVVLNTILENPAAAEFAMDFYRSRLAASADFHTRAAAAFYRDQCANLATPFWSRRARNAEDAPRTDVHPNTIVRISPDLEFAKVAIAENAQIVPEDGVKLRGKSFAFVDGRSVHSLLKQLDRPLSAQAVVTRWSRSIPPTQAMRLLHWAWRERLLE